jgi:hypothetical protein
MTSGLCSACRKPVLWALTVNNKRIPLDPRPDPDGNQAAYRDGTGGYRTRQLKDDQEPSGYERRYMPHFATCTRRDKPATAAPAPTATVLPENVIPISRGRELRRGKPLRPPVQRRGQR